MVQPPNATAEAHFDFPAPPFELVGELTIPFELAEEGGADGADKAAER